MRLSKYARLGLLIVFTLVILIWGINFLKGIDFFKKNTAYHVHYDRIDGLVESSSVTMNGYQVGQVKTIAFADNNDGSLLVTFTMEGDFRLPKGSVARIVSSDIMGTKSIKLQINPSNSYYEPGDTIPGSIEEDLKEQVSMQVLPLKNRAEELLSTLDSAITVVTVIFNEEARKNLSESFVRINQTILNLESASHEIDLLLTSERTNIQGIIQNLNGITATLNENSGEFSNIMGNFSSISDSLAAVGITELINDLAGSVNSINQIIAKVNNGEGSAGMLLSDDELYANLTDMSQSLDLLLKDIRNNPKRYLHFSAFDLGKDIYVSPRKEKSNTVNNDYTFKVHLISSPSRLDTENTVFNKFDGVEEVEIPGGYSYLTGNSSDIAKIMNIHSDAKLTFPDASIVAFKNGRKVKLEKALKAIGD
jgi:phospholipid/cholesterol/gamma-HCH transport system substrate-binding protein